MDDPELEEEFRQLKKRDLFQTYLFKKACRSFETPKIRRRVFIAPPMQKLAPPVARGPYLPTMTAGRRSKNIVEELRDVYPYLLRHRRAYRKDFDSIGYLDSWFKNKPSLTKIESNVLGRRKQAHKSPPVHVSLDGQRSVQNTYDVYEPKWSKQLLLKRKAGSRKHMYTATALEEREEHHRMEGKQGREVSAQEVYYYQSSLGGPTGSAVDHFKKHCVREYLESIERCQQHGLAITSATLKRVLVHPSDIRLRSFDVFDHKSYQKSQKSHSILPEVIKKKKKEGKKESKETERKEKGKKEEEKERKEKWGEKGREEKRKKEGKKERKEKGKKEEEKERKEKGKKEEEKEMERKEKGKKVEREKEKKEKKGKKEKGKGKKEENEEEQEDDEEEEEEEDDDDDDDTDEEKSNQHEDHKMFWPGRYGHVRLYPTVRSNHPRNVLFHRVERSPVTNPGHWPVNPAGYFTCGDITRQKVYIL